MASMDSPRDIQNFLRNERARATVSSCSSLGMEIKRKKIRQSTVFLPKEDSSIPEKIDFEVRMREGAYKLLVASTKRDQILNASRSLLTCNTRIVAYVTELQRRTEDLDAQAAVKGRVSDPVPKDRVPCLGKVALSGLRIPLMWKDSDHFSNKGSSRRVAVFCLMKIGAQVFDTEMVVVDKSATDICFEGLTIFSGARPHFQLTLELYGCAMEEDASLVNTPKKLARKLRNSLGKASGKKVCPLLEAGDPESFLQSHPIPHSARYSLLAYTTLCLAQAEGTFQSHSLIVTENAESSSWLPLYGSLCCRLVAQPDCMIQEMMSGFLNQQQSVGGVKRCCSLYCVLSAGSLACYYSPEEIQAKMEPALTIPINKDTRIRMVYKEQGKGSNSLNIISPGAGQAGESSVFTADSREELQAWVEAFWQHLYDQAEWQHCCSELMKIEVMSPKKPPLFQTRHADSVYNDLSIGSPGKFESLTDIIHNKIEETGGRFLIGQEEETEAPDWSALFGGPRPLVVQKSVLSPSRDDGHPSPNCSGPKKRRAPPPPPDKQPYAPATDSTAHIPLNSAPYASSITSSPSTPRLASVPHALLTNAPYASSITSDPYTPRLASAPHALLNNAPYTSSITSDPYTPRLASAPHALLNNAPYTSSITSAPYAPLQQKQRKPGTRSGRPSLDAKFSAIIQQLQKNHGPAHRPAPVHPEDSENQPPDRPPQPVPAPRHKRKSFREKINPKGW
ncbi:rhotekin-2 isoform X1 [Conger conger]|uniref:rhotekin-2 isoform X1 n=2 Tax=Conger conger TaxID=82655 RepID=UPI002A5A88AB|nr:rhotekin-2 isoform X1 [Conger conger]XP_061084159.1 rhotekin-2 isoform X1 [Conger conger]